MGVRYQWVKFSDAAWFQSEDYKAGDWILAEIDDEFPDGGITLFGVEYCMRQSEVAEWGPEVPRPESI
ncbi:hypothetical protein K3722_07585 [Leisingera caerulea]|uniref:Uncharacterized protein n=1 Tax=Leisingera caerulea TaxID=506591 RepID=A0ABY5X079_LEICA|nr:hypothetical protein [Leisingera caerulea]UWQ59983.1 hypothetical protein K3722_07585 [Leisingera caerulea]